MEGKKQNENKKGENKRYCSSVAARILVRGQSMAAARSASATSSSRPVTLSEHGLYRKNLSGEASSCQRLRACRTQRPSRTLSPSFSKLSCHVALVLHTRVVAAVSHSPTLLKNKCASVFREEHLTTLMMIFFAPPTLSVSARRWKHVVSRSETRHGPWVGAWGFRADSPKPHGASWEGPTPRRNPMG